METREREREEQAANGKSATPPVATVVDETEEKPRRPIVWIVAGIVAIAAILFWGIPYLQYSRAHQSTDDARVDATVVAVTSKINERISSILVDTNQPVHKGQPLVVLDSVTE
ncbi:MAG TPA: biotin/lipoyl-binding protein [Candidatus Baltobacteraceae bacterium]|nr:biotin/lipoyl-binding protein [Candidatus Baltobacteraceae bacterium]